MPTSPTSPLAAKPPGRLMRILYADDLFDLRKLVTLLLNRDGHTVDSVEDGGRALRQVSAATTPYDLVITDHHMPGMNGLALVGRLRDTGYSGRIIVFSSELDRAVHEDYRRHRVDHILQKPVLPETLRQVVARL